jgi:hypothetical protein
MNQNIQLSAFGLEKPYKVFKARLSCKIDQKACDFGMLSSPSDRLSQRYPVPPKQTQMRALARQRDGDRAANAAACPGDTCNASTEIDGNLLQVFDRLLC